MDYPAWMSEITSTLNRGYVDLMSQKTAVGAGTTEPTGLFTAMVATTTSPSHVTVTTLGALGAVDVRKAWAALPERFRPSATWCMHQDVLNQIRNADGAAAQVDLVVDRQGTSLMGRPVITSSYFPDFTGTTGIRVLPDRRRLERLHRRQPARRHRRADPGDARPGDRSTPR